METKATRFAWILWAVCCPASAAFAHGGGLDANGGHMDHRTGTYHFHGGGGGGGGGGFSGWGLGGSGSVYSPPAPRVRARTSARAKPRTEAKSSARQPPLNMNTSYSAPSDPETRARELLRLAKLLLGQDKVPGAIGLLQELMAKYPRTDAAKEGSALLAPLKDYGKLVRP